MLASWEGSVQGYGGAQDLTEVQCRDTAVCRGSWEHLEGHLSWGGGQLASVLRGKQEDSSLVT